MRTDAGRQTSQSLVAMDDAERGELVGRADAIQRQLELVRGLRESPDETDLEQLCNRLLERLEEIEIQLGNWQDE